MFFKSFRLKKESFCCCMVLICFLTSCSSVNFNSTLSPFSSLAGIQDFGDPNATKLKQKAQRLESHKQETLIITQFGDSHSAADFFTGKVRTLMQDHFGNAGIGWIPPMTVSGQYHTAVKWENKNWALTSSRTQKAEFPLGGFIATASQANNFLKVIPTIEFDPKQEWNVKLWLKAPQSSLTSAVALSLENNLNQKLKLPINQNDQKWASITVSTFLPFSLTAPDKLELGGFWLQKKAQAGVILSPIATNGAQLSILEIWSPIWKTQLQSIQSDLIILEFGTNEAFNDVFSASVYREQLIAKIQELRQVSPNSAILLISPPDSFASKDTALSCAERYPANFNLIKQIQLDVAKSEKTLYWDWQRAMGGSCSIEKWANLQLAKKDLVHLTRAGYDKTATIFYEDFLDFIASFQIIRR